MLTVAKPEQLTVFEHFPTGEVAVGQGRFKYIPNAIGAPDGGLVDIATPDHPKKHSLGQRRRDGTHVEPLVRVGPASI